MRVQLGAIGQMVQGRGCSRFAGCDSGTMDKSAREIKIVDGGHLCLKISA